MRVLPCPLSFSLLKIPLAAMAWIASSISVRWVAGVFITLLKIPLAAMTWIASIVFVDWSGCTMTILVRRLALVLILTFLE